MKKHSCIGTEHPARWRKVTFLYAMRHQNQFDGWGEERRPPKVLSFVVHNTEIRVAIDVLYCSMGKVCLDFRVSAITRLTCIHTPE